MYLLFASMAVISISKSLLFTANNYKISQMTRSRDSLHRGLTVHIPIQFIETSILI